MNVALESSIVIYQVIVKQHHILSGYKVEQMYQIKKRQNDQAKRLGVSIKVSANPKKKLDVYKNGVLVASIGAMGYGDYATYLEQDKEFAEMKRKNYKARHEKDRKKVGTPSYYADQILWS